MTSGLDVRSDEKGAHSGMSALVRSLASWKLTAALFLIVAGAVGCSAYLERTRGHEWAQWSITGTTWFLVLLIALAGSIALATVMHFPRTWSRRGLLLLPLGAIIALAGCVWSLLQGFDGRLVFWKGKPPESVVLLANRSKITLITPRADQAQVAELVFSPGPADWRPGQKLNFGQVNGVGVGVVGFYRHAQSLRTWVPDASGHGDPAIQVSISAPAGGKPATFWCVPLLFGGPPPPGGVNVSIKRTTHESLRSDFLSPPDLAPGSRGILSAHYEGHAYAIPVDEYLGKKYPLGTTGATVEILDFYANSLMKKDQFFSEGDAPKNPMLRLSVEAPGLDHPVSEIAYANQPFVNYESLEKRPCPVEFWYHHPATPRNVGTTVEFLQMPDEKLLCRTCADGAYQARGEVQPGAEITATNERKLKLLHHLPHARSEGTFEPVDIVAVPTTTEPEAAALVELKAPQKTEQFWMRRNDAQLGARKLKVAGEDLIIMFGYEARALKPAISLVGLQYDARSVALGKKTSCVSQVRLANGPVREIRTNRPLRYRTLTFAQAGFQQMPQGTPDLSVLRVTSEPGRPLSIAGCVSMGVGALYGLALFLSSRRSRSVLASTAPKMSE